MTGLFHSNQSGEVCPDCKQTAKLADWTCCHCGRILDRYLFKTVTRRSVTGAAKDAFWAGNQACTNQWKQSGSVALGVYKPIPGHETSYRAGWQYASDEIEAKGERKHGRRRGLQLLGSGAALTIGGGIMAAAGSLHQGDALITTTFLLLGSGVLNLALGAFALITGESDALPPDLPGTGSAVVAEPQSPPRTRKIALPHAVLTWVVLALNVMVLLAMLLSGASIMNPTPAVLITWGANFGLQTITAGQWWRLLTSMFLHVGILHILFNMIALIQIGPLIERLLGKTGFAIVYLAAGLAGSLASLAWNPYLVSAGASGAIFGLYGALLGILALRRHGLPSEAVRSLLSFASLFVGYNIVQGITNPQTDTAAHAGGLACGFLCGLALSLSPTPQNLTRRRIMNGTVALVVAALLLVVAGRLPEPFDFQRFMSNLSGLRTRTLTKYRAALSQYRAGEVAANDFATVVETQVLTEWNKEHDTLASMHGLPVNETLLRANLVRYMELRRKAWLLESAGIGQRNLAKMKEAKEQQQAADRELMELSAFLRRSP